MSQHKVPAPRRVRKITKPFAWIDNRLLRNGFLQVMTHQEMSLYLFLVLVGDRQGVSFYRKENMCEIVSLTFKDFDIARDRLIDLELIAFESYNALSPNGHYQILPIEHQAPDFRAMIWEQLETKKPK